MHFDEEGRAIIGARLKTRNGLGFRDLEDRKLQKELDGSLCMADKPEILELEQKRGTFDTCHRIVDVLTQHYGMIVFIFIIVKPEIENEIVRLLKEGLSWTPYDVSVMKGELVDKRTDCGRNVLKIELLNRIV